MQIENSLKVQLNTLVAGSWGGVRERCKSLWFSCWCGIHYSIHSANFCASSWRYTVSLHENHSFSAVHVRMRNSALWDANLALGTELSTETIIFWGSWLHDVCNLHWTQESCWPPGSTTSGPWKSVGYRCPLLKVKCGLCRGLGSFSWHVNRNDALQDAGMGTLS